MFRKGMIAVLTIALTALLTVPSVFASSVTIIDGSQRTPGTWYAGNTPPDLDANKPVLLFVQGLNSSAGMWWDNNDMYDKAYAAGYQTAFVELNDSAGTPKNMWNNGQLLAEAIQKVHDHFQKPIVIVAHSKGGIDTQAALIHYNAYPYVPRVITIGSPHYGSQVADLAYSAWASWLTALLGQKNEATYSLQTGYMNYFRSLTDTHNNAQETTYLTLAGNGWNSSFFSSFYAGGLYLSAYGPNDGVVTVKNSYLPYGNMIKIGKWNHHDETKGSKTFSVFEPYLNASGTSLTFADSSSMKSRLKQKSTSTTDFLVHGGLISEQSKEAFLVENDVKQITIDLISSSPLQDIDLINPSGDKQKGSWESFEDSQFFKGAYHNVLKVKQPEQGKWKLNLVGDESKDNGYLLNVYFESKLSKHVGISWKKGALSVTSDKSYVDQNQLGVEYQVNYLSDKEKNDNKKAKVIKQTKVDGNADFDLSMKKSGIYNITAEISGKTTSGVPFERTVIRSIYVDEKGRQY